MLGKVLLTTAVALAINGYGAQGSCPDGWAAHEQSCYRAFEIYKDWASARDYCGTYNADLVSITTTAEQEFMTQLISNLGGSFLIGLHDTATENVFAWVDNTPYDPALSMWNNGEPNDAGSGEDCAIMFTLSGVGKWNDLSCSATRYFVCETQDPEPRCGGTLNAPPEGTVFSPNHPNNYENHEQCEWLINAPEGCTVLLTFESFHVEGGWDFVYVYDGDSDAAPPLQTLTGNALPDPITSTSNQMFVKFTSDNVYTKPGFRFTYKAVCAIDIVLVLDVSSSIPQDQFLLARDFMMAFVDCAAFQGLNIRIGVICYNCEAKTYFGLQPIYNGMSYSIHYVMYKGGETRTGHAIYYMTCTSDFEAKRVGVILTDGRSGDNEVAEAENARDMGITLYAVRIGDPRFVDSAALATMTGDFTRVFDTDQACELAWRILADQCGVFPPI